MKNFKSAGVVSILGLLLGLSATTVLVSCERSSSDELDDAALVSLPELASIFSRLPLEQEHLDEVHVAVTASSTNGYDEEYRMSDLFKAPGSGVGASELETRASSAAWRNPLRSLLEDYIRSNYATKADTGFSAEEFISALTESDAQIYWPYSESWDGKSYPIITYDPGADVSSNEGYAMTMNGVEKVMVTEEMAREGNVWVINSNDDSSYTSLEMLRRQDPDWGKGGTIIVTPTKASESDNGVRTLILKDFEMKRNFDCWLAGASEFFVKTGSVEDFKASTEAELKLYSPYITDFMIVVKRSQVNQKIPFNAVLVSEWTDQLDKMAFMIVEDDGGTKTSWSTSATVKIQSKSYGFDISIPYNSRDDIVWRGQVSRKYFEAYSNVEGHFGDVYLTFEIL